VNRELVQEGGGDVETVRNVVEGTLGLGDVVRGGQDGVVGSANSTTPTLESWVDHSAATGYVLLVIGVVRAKAAPLVSGRSLG